MDGVIQFQEHLAPAWCAVFPPQEQALLGWGWVGGSCAVVAMQCGFSSPEAVKTQIKAPFILHPMPVLQCVARADPATGATSFLICLKIKTSQKHRNVSPGTLDVDLWYSCALTRIILLLWGLFREDEQPRPQLEVREW